jgi:hypothetical protein
MNKDGSTLAWKNDVWCSGQVATVDAIAKSRAKKRLPKQNFRPGILLAYPCHHR